MYPQEITTTSLWLRHNLPLGPSPPSDGDDKIRKEIKSQNVKLTDDMIEQYVRQERARLDLKWCLDEYFGWNSADPHLGQLVTANIFGFVHLSYIIDISPANVTVISINRFGNAVVIGFDDIYSAEDGPFYKNFLLNDRLLHPQHILDYVVNQKRQEETRQFDHNASFEMIMEKYIGENFEIEWPEGQETWLIHDDLPQRSHFSKCTHQLILTTSTSNIVEYPVQQVSSECVCATSSSSEHHNEVIRLIQQILVKQDALIKNNRLLREELLRQQLLIDKLGIEVESIEETEILHMVILSQEPQLTTIPVLQALSDIDKIDILDLKEETVKQLQLHRIDQLDGFSYECDRNTHTFSTKSTVMFSSDSDKSYSSQLCLASIILITFIFIGMVFSSFNYYLPFYGGTKASYLADNLVSHGINDLEWFRNLAVP